MKQLVCLVALSLLCATGASAHAFTPAGIWIEETSAAQYQIQFRRSLRFADSLTLVLPQACVRGASRRRAQAEQVVDTFSLRCETPLQGQTLGVAGLPELSLSAVLQAKLMDGRRVRALLSARRQSITLPKRGWLSDVFFDYLRLGVEHLLTGWDHILFVVGLLCLSYQLSRLVVTLTAFTLGHSITLALSALSWVRLPQAPIEVGIALSLLVVAMEIAVACTGRSEGAPRVPSTRPFRYAGAFGLLHGLGFAGALSEAGLPETDLPLSLLAFNLGVEVGQLLVVAITLSLLWLLQLRWRGHESTLRLSAAYVIGSLAVMVGLERVTTLFG